MAKAARIIFKQKVLNWWDMDASQPFDRHLKQNAASPISAEIVENFS